VRYSVVCFSKDVKVSVKVRRTLSSVGTSSSNNIEQVLLVYGRAGFSIRRILMDKHFEKIKNSMPTVECNTTAAKEHASKVEQTIRTIKEQTQGIVATLPFRYISKQMKIKFTYFTVLWLNEFPVKNEDLCHLLATRTLDYKKAL
jgi:hypothetical protein